MDMASVGQGSESQDSDEPAPPGTSSSERLQFKMDSKLGPTTSMVSAKGVENAKKRLRAFSIQKKAPLTPVAVAKPMSTGNTTVLIGKLNSVKVTPKIDDEQKKPPRPPKPGAGKKLMPDYSDLQKKTLSEIEDMKRKMELVELGIPLGLISPCTSDKAMPTKAMPPIKTFLDSAKIDEIIREAKKARAEGREFKFDYQKFVPDYDNPFQRKKEDPLQQQTPGSDRKEEGMRTPGYKDKRKFDKDRYDRRHGFGRDSFERDRYKGDKRSRERESMRDKSRENDKSREKEEVVKERDEKIQDKDERPKDNRDKSDVRDEEKVDDKNKDSKEEVKKPKDKTVQETPADVKPTKETDVNLSDFVVCDSWSLDNDEKNNSPQVEDKTKNKVESKQQAKETKATEPMELLKQSLSKKKDTKAVDSPKEAAKFGKLKPVIDSFKYEIDPNDDDVDEGALDIFYEDVDIQEFGKLKSKKGGMFDSFDFGKDDIDDTSFLESVINEIKQENVSAEEDSQDKGLVEYDSPSKDAKEPTNGSVTPELDDHARDIQSQRSDYSDGHKSTDSTKSVESGYKSASSSRSRSSTSGSIRLSSEKEIEDNNMSKSTVDSLETWSFVLKICQPMLFRHNNNNCYKETRTNPKLWFTENPKLCSCVRDRAVVYEELEMCKAKLVGSIYNCERLPDIPPSLFRMWYPRANASLAEAVPILPTCEWEVDEPAQPATPDKRDEVLLDLEYKKFMEAVWPEVAEAKEEAPGSTTPEKQESRKTKKQVEDDRKAKKMKLSSDGWSQESEVEEELDKSKKAKEKLREKRKRKHVSPSLSQESDSEGPSKKKKKSAKKKASKKSKLKSAKRRNQEKKMMKKIKNKKQKKQKIQKIEEESEVTEETDIETKKKQKKAKKKKLQKLKKKSAKKKKKVSSSSSDSSSSDSSSESESETERRARKKKEKAKKKKDKKKKRKQSSSDSVQSEELFDVNILNNIKTERLTDDEKTRNDTFSPLVKHREIINVKELHEDFSTIQIKKEKEDELKKSVTESQDNTIEPESTSISDPVETEENQPKSVEVSIEKKQKEREIVEREMEADKLNRFDLNDSQDLPQYRRFEKTEKAQFKEPEPPPRQDDISQCSSQESICSKDAYEKDESHLRPSSQNSNYSFRDVIASQENYHKIASPEGYHKEEGRCEGYESYDMYEQMAMAYQSDVASQQHQPGAESGSNTVSRIETVVRARSGGDGGGAGAGAGAARGEIKCDWRAGAAAQAQPGASRPSRWGLKPGEVNIVLTGGETAPVYKIQSLANRTDSGIGYDAAYAAVYGAADRAQYGDCFAERAEPRPPRPSLDQRINRALANNALGEVTKEPDGENDSPEKGILVTKSLSISAGRGAKRVSFADGYKPGQDSDVEEPPAKKRKKPRRVGCPWPCPTTHPDHCPLWDALPPPPPPPGSPPPPSRAAPPTHLLRPAPHHYPQLMPPPHHQKFDPNTVSLPSFMPPEPPPGIITFP